VGSGRTMHATCRGVPASDPLETQYRTPSVREEALADPRGELSHGHAGMLRARLLAHVCGAEDEEVYDLLPVEVDDSESLAREHVNSSPLTRRDQDRLAGHAPPFSSGTLAVSLVGVRTVQRPPGTPDGSLPQHARARRQAEIKTTRQKSR
jgi:hypothetical protein